MFETGERENYFGDFLCPFNLMEPSRFGLIGGIGRWILSQTTFCKGSMPLLVDGWFNATNVVVDRELGSVAVRGDGACFLLKVERRASGLAFRGRSRSGCWWRMTGTVGSWGSSAMGAWTCCCGSFDAFGRGEERNRARIDWWAAAGGGGGGVGEVTLENEHVRAGGRGGGSAGPSRARFVLLAKSVPTISFPAPRREELGNTTTRVSPVPFSWVLNPTVVMLSSSAWISLNVGRSSGFHRQPEWNQTRFQQWMFFTIDLHFCIKLYTSVGQPVGRSIRFPF